MMGVYIAALGIFLIYVICNEVAYARTVGRETAFLADFDEFLSQVRHFYYYTNSAEDAIFYSIPKCSARIRPAVRELSESLEKGDRVSVLADVTGGSHKYVRLFASLVMMVSENGDVYEGSSSVFLDSLMQLRNDVQAERRYMESRKHRFTGLGLTAALPAAAAPAIAKWGSSTIPSLNSFYEGRWGALMLLVIFVITLMCYSAIDCLRQGRGKGLLKLNTLIPRDEDGEITSPFFKKAAEVIETVAADGLLKKTILAAIAVPVTVAVLLAGHAGARRLLLYDVSDVENVSDTADGNQVEAMERVIPEYVGRYLGQEAPGRDALAESLLNENGIRSGSVAGDTADEILRRLERFGKERFDIFDLLATAIAACLAWLFPEVADMFAGALADEHKQDEVMRFQSLIHMQKRVPGVTPVEILESMEAFADIFKGALRQCINNYNVNEERALNELLENAGHPEFAKIVECFLAVDEAGVENAFEEVSAQVTNFRENRELDRTILLDNSVLLASLLAVIPGGLVLFGYLLIPFMGRAMTMFNDYQDALGGYMEQ